MIDFFLIGHYISGMETLTRVATKGDAETSYVCAMLLLCNNEEKKHRRRGVEFFEIIRVSGAIKRCGEVFREIFEQQWVRGGEIVKFWTVRSLPVRQLPYPRHHGCCRRCVSYLVCALPDRLQGAGVLGNV
ncbi:hypothetical protein AHAS_Ahas04G0172900 [Arachis hypogaea]